MTNKLNTKMISIHFLCLVAGEKEKVHGVQVYL